MKENKFLRKIIFPFVNFLFENFIDVIGNENFYKLFKKGLAFYLKNMDYNIRIYENGKEIKNKKLTKPTLIIANHDDIFSGLYMIYAIEQRIYSIISMSAEPTWYKTPFENIIKRYAFIVEKNNIKVSLNGLNKAITCLKDNSVLIFANGPASIGNFFTRDYPYQKGAAFIVKEAIKRKIDFYILPVFIKTGKYLNPETGVGSDKNILINFGDIIYTEEINYLGLKEITEFFKKRISSLEIKLVS